jgi:hypothetical protein
MSQLLDKSFNTNKKLDRRAVDGTGVLSSFSPRQLGDDSLSPSELCLARMACTCATAKVVTIALWVHSQGNPCGIMVGTVTLWYIPPRHFGFPCQLSFYECFILVCYQRLVQYAAVPRDPVSFNSSPLKMEAIYFCEKSGRLRTSRCYNPEGLNVQSYRHEHLTSSIRLFFHMLTKLGLWQYGRNRLRLFENRVLRKIGGMWSEEGWSDERPEKNA